MGSFLRGAEKREPVFAGAYGLPGTGQGLTNCISFRVTFCRKPITPLLQIKLSLRGCQGHTAAQWQNTLYYFTLFQHLETKWHG